MKTKWVSLQVLFLSLIAFCGIAPAADDPETRAFSVVFPEGFDHLDANSSTRIPAIYPLNEIAFSLGAIRYQQVYDASVFHSLPPGGAWILNVLFREDCSNTRGGNSARTNIEIFLSTTVRSPDGLSAVFSENAGFDAMKFVGPTNRAFEGSLNSCQFRPSAGWDTLFVGTPFFYNPAKGNLLLELRSPGALEAQPRGHVILDAVDGVDGSSRVYGTSLTEPEAEFADTLGLATQFTFMVNPKLVASFGTNELVVKWPASPYPFRLQTASSIDRADWKDFEGVIQILDGGLKTISIPVQNLKVRQYFRLFWNSPQPGISSVVTRGSLELSQP